MYYEYSNVFGYQKIQQNGGAKTRSNLYKEQSMSVSFCTEARFPVSILDYHTIRS